MYIEVRVYQERGGPGREGGGVWTRQRVKGTRRAAAAPPARGNQPTLEQDGRQEESSSKTQSIEI